MAPAAVAAISHAAHEVALSVAPPTHRLFPPFIIFFLSSPPPSQLDNNREKKKRKRENEITDIFSTEEKKPK